MELRRRRRRRRCRQLMKRPQEKIYFSGIQFMDVKVKLISQRGGHLLWWVL